MGRLSTALNLPKQIFLKDWGATEFTIDPNILLSFTFILEPTPLGGSIITYSSVYSPSYPAPQKIYFWGSYWELRDIGDNSGQWVNNSSSKILPLTGWEIDNAQGPAGTITPILTNTKNISIKKQNLGGGRLLSPKLNQRIIPYFIIIQSGIAYYDEGNSVAVSAGNSIRFFTNSTTSGLKTMVDASGNIVTGFSSTFIDLFYPNGGTYFITLTQPGDAFYKSATLTITVNVLVALVGGGSSGVGIGGGGI